MKEQSSQEESLRKTAMPYQKEPPARELEDSEKSGGYDSSVLVTFPRKITVSDDSEKYTSAFLQQELSVRKLNSIHKHLWWAGRPGNVRPLHRQRMLSRRILVTEDPSLHLVWYHSTIFIKPLPSFLVTWDSIIDERWPSAEVQSLATGFFSTYLRLICHPSDFKIAHELGLLPGSMSWESWCNLSQAFCRKYPINEYPINEYPINVNQRYLYGELRLSRLNQIYRFCRLERQYFSPYTEYGHFFTSNFAWFFVMFACLSVVLGALQVVLATSDTTIEFANMTYGFSMFAIGLTFGAVMFVIGLFTSLFLYFLQNTLRLHAKGGV
ncbi:hypothetical protein MMC17_008671 [Xylographa soralifera]|nr:hypothetical protein [Xylographa soralifera]